MKNFIAILLLTLGIGLTANAQTSQTVKFPKGKTTVTLKGTITGYKYIDYVFSAKNNQYFSAKITGKKVRMVIFEPDGEPMPDAGGITDITSKIDVSGKYKIRVLMFRNEARRKNAKSEFTLVLEVAKQK